MRAIVVREFGGRPEAVDMPTPTAGPGTLQIQMTIDDAKTFTRKPLHDWSSHTADAWRYLATVVRHADVMTRKPDPDATRKAAAEALRRHVDKPNTLGNPWDIEPSSPSRRL